MNIITDALDDSVEFKGKVYPVKTDFKVWLRFHQIVTDKNKNSAEKSASCILCCFDSARCKRLPDTLEEAMELLFKFFAAGNEPKGGKKVKAGKKVFDFTEDSGYIYASFFQEYGIDLAKTNMHWYRFLALLNNLSENTQLGKIIAWRSVDLSKIEDPKRRDFYRRMKNLYKFDTGDERLTEGNIADEISRAF